MTFAADEEAAIRAKGRLMGHEAMCTACKEGAPCKRGDALRAVVAGEAPSEPAPAPLPEPVPEKPPALKRRPFRGVERRITDERQRKVIDYLKRNPDSTAGDVARGTGMSVSVAHNQLGSLYTKKIVDRAWAKNVSGTGPGWLWRAAEEDE